MNIILKKGKEFSFFKTCYIYKFAKVNNSKLPRKSFYNKYIFYHRLSLFNYLLYSKKSILKRKYHHTALYKPILYLNKLIFDILIAILFVFTLYKILEYGINKYANKNTIIKKVTIILRNVLENNETHELLAKLILNEFVRNKSTEKKMSKLFAKILRQDNINKKLDILLKKIIIDYLRSEECFQVILPLLRNLKN